MAKQFRMKHLGDRITMPIDARGNVIYTEKEVEQINRERNAVRLSGVEMEQMIGLIASGNLFRQCAKELEKGVPTATTATLTPANAAQIAAQSWEG